MSTTVTAEAKAAVAGTRPVTGLAFRVHAALIGPLLLAASGAGLVRVAFAEEGHDAVRGRLEVGALGDLAGSGVSATGPSADAAERVLDIAAAQIDEYLAGTRPTFDVPLSPVACSAFRRRVLDEMARIPYGERLSYGELAVRAGVPGASRAVGTTCATNPLPLVVPCHRVVRADGAIGAYLGGAALKGRLLAMEAGPAGA